MAIMISIIKKMYRTLLPVAVRNSPIVAELKAHLLHLLGHDWIYDSDGSSPSLRPELSLATPSQNALLPIVFIS